MDFLPGDSVIVSASTDGVFYGHSIGSSERVFETILRNLKLKKAKIVMGR